VNYDDSHWQQVSISHDWSIALSYTRENSDGKHVRVEFDGVHNNSTVYINGIILGERPNGYSSFTLIFIGAGCLF